MVLVILIVAFEFIVKLGNLTSLDLLPSPLWSKIPRFPTVDLQASIWSLRFVVFYISWQPFFGFLLLILQSECHWRVVTGRFAPGHQSTSRGCSLLLCMGFIAGFSFFFFQYTSASVNVVRYCWLNMSYLFWLISFERGCVNLLCQTHTNSLQSCPTYCNIFPHFKIVTIFFEEIIPFKSCPYFWIK